MQNIQNSFLNREIYQDEVQGDVVDMNTCQIFLGHPWKIDVD